MLVAGEESKIAFFGSSLLASTKNPLFWCLLLARSRAIMNRDECWNPYGDQCGGRSYRGGFFMPEIRKRTAFRRINDFPPVKTNNPCAISTGVIVCPGVQSKLIPGSLCA